MPKIRFIHLGLAVLFAVVVSSSAVALSAGNVIMTSTVFSSGGGSVVTQSQSVRLISTIGESVAGCAESPSYYLSVGFFGCQKLSPTAIDEGKEPVAPVTDNQVYLPIIKR